MANIRQGEVANDFSQTSKKLNTSSGALTLHSQLFPGLHSQLSAGFLQEKHSLLGNSGSGIWGLSDGTLSWMTGINFSYQLMPELNALATYNRLFTQGGQKNDLTTYSDNLVSDSFSVGILSPQ